MRGRHQRSSGVFVAAAGAGIVVLGIVALVIAHFYRPPFDYGELAPKIAAAEQHLDAAPCNSRAAVELGDAMVEAGDAVGALRVTDAYFKKCGDEPRLRWVSYGAHKQLAQWPLAIGDASLLIESEPGDKDFRWWRGICYERTGKLELAATDYEKAIELEPRLTNIPLNLVDVYERLRRPCDAARTLRRYLDAHPDLTEQFTPRLAALELRCKPPVPL